MAGVRDIVMVVRWLQREHFDGVIGRIVASLANLVAAGAAVRVASNSILGQPISVADAYRESLGRFLSLLVASIVAGANPAPCSMHISYA